MYRVHFIILFGYVPLSVGEFILFAASERALTPPSPSHLKTPPFGFGCEGGTQNVWTIPVGYEFFGSRWEARARRGAAQRNSGVTPQMYYVGRA